MPQRTCTSHSRALFAVTALSLSCAMVGAHAGRPMVVDDAAIVGPNNCQLESWVYNDVSRTEYWAVPACNFTGNLELAVGAARIVGSGQRGNVLVLQGKTLFKPLNNNGWGVGLVFGTQTVLDRSGLGDVFATVPVSFSFRDNGTIVNVNAGVVRMKSLGRAHGTWGLGMETAIDERTTLTAEAFGQQGEKPLAQLGIKYWVTENRVQLDATCGNRIGHGIGNGIGQGRSARFLTVGLVLFTNVL